MARQTVDRHGNTVELTEDQKRTAATVNAASAAVRQADLVIVAIEPGTQKAETYLIDKTYINQIRAERVARLISEEEYKGKIRQGRTIREIEFFESIGTITAQQTPSQQGRLF